MKRLVVGMMVLWSGCACAAEYSVVRSTTAHVYDRQGIQKDRCATSITTTLSVQRSDRIMVDVGTLRLQAEDGASYLAMQSEMLALFSRREVTPEPASRLSIAPSEPNALEWTCAAHVVRGSSYKRLEKAVLALLADSKLEYSTVFPVAFVCEIPFVWTVDKTVKSGDRIEIPFRSVPKPDHRSSKDRAASLICTNKDDETVVLESNYEKDARGMLVTWHVRVVFDTRRQLPVSMVEDRFTRIVADGSAGENIHTVRQSIQCRLSEAGAP